MHRRTRWLVTLVVGVGLPLTACAAPPAAPGSTAANAGPATIEALADGRNQITLSEKAVERLGIQTATVAAEPASAGAPARTVVPYAAVLYQPDGLTFTYTNPAPLTFVKQDISVESIRGDQAVLTAGPAVGTAVVTAGSAELWGAEFKVGKY
jgi:hypothetical protein